MPQVYRHVTIQGVCPVCNRPFDGATVLVMDSPENDEQIWIRVGLIHPYTQMWNGSLCLGSCCTHTFAFQLIEEGTACGIQ